MWERSNLLEAGGWGVLGCFSSWPFWGPLVQILNSFMFPLFPYQDRAGTRIPSTFNWMNLSGFLLLITIRALSRTSQVFIDEVVISMGLEGWLGFMWKQLHLGFTVYQSSLWFHKISLTFSITHNLGLNPGCLITSLWSWKGYLSVKFRYLLCRVFARIKKSVCIWTINTVLGTW